MASNHLHLAPNSLSDKAVHTPFPDLPSTHEPDASCPLPHPLTTSHQPLPSPSRFGDSLTPSNAQFIALGVAQRGANAKPQPQPSTDSTTRTPSSARFARKGLELSQSNDDDSATPLPPPELFSPRQSRSFFDHRSHRKQALSIDSIPRQTIMKSLASRPPLTALSIPTSGIHGSLSSREDDDLRPPPVTSRRLSQALSEINSDSKSLYAGKMATLASPLFFHEGFDDAVNINKVLEEIRDDEYMSHSRLMQTATGVREVAKQLQRRPIKRAVRNVMIITKARDNSLVSLTRELAEFLITTPRYGSQVGVNVYVDAKLRKSKRFDVPSLLAKDPRFEYMLRFWTPDMCWTSPEQFDLVLTLGGDGTVLFTSWLFQRIVPPVLSFSLGSLGFLTNFEYQTFRKSLNNLMGEEGMRVNLRMRFTCTVYRAVPGDPNSHIEAEQFEVLNELLIDRGPSPYISQLELYGDNNLLTVIQADGCIFSTPTGSTAYSLSAGGSLIHPDIPAILLTPICPHTLSFRPMLLNDTMLLRVAVPRNSRATAYCAFDGKGRVELRQGDHVTIAASKFPFPTVLSKPTEWFDSISTSLRWNTRGAAQKGWEEGNAEGDEEKFGSGFDIDIDDDDSADSGYSGGSSSAGDGVSPVKSL